MNKKLLISSIGSVAGYMAIVLISLIAIVVALTKFPTIVWPLVVLGFFGWMVSFEYKERVAKEKREIALRLNNIMKK